jgi:hypothetical protein
MKIFVKVPLTLPSSARGEGFRIPLPRREGLGEGDVGANRNAFHRKRLPRNKLSTSGPNQRWFLFDMDEFL